MRGDIVVPKWTVPRMPKAAAEFGGVGNDGPGDL